jgi:hypothetical protein
MPNMKLSRVEMLAAGQILERYPDLKTLAVDGKKVTNLADAAAAYRRYEMHSPGKLASFVDRGTSKIIGKVERGQAKLAEVSARSKLLSRIVSSAPVRWLMQLIRTDTEAVKGEVVVDARLASGAALRLPLQVEDVRASLILQRTSLITELVSLVPVIPFIGTIVSLVAAAATTLAAAGAGLARQRELARALMRTAGKYLVEAALIVPVAGSVVVAAAAAADASDVKRLSASP